MKRFVEISSLNRPLYTAGGPVIIQKVSVFYDSLEKKRFILCKIKNVSVKTIVSTDLKLKVYDKDGKVIDDNISYEYQGIEAIQNNFFGEKTVINTNVKGVFKAIAYATKVVFEDGTEWVLDENQKWGYLKPLTQIAKALPSGTHLLGYKSFFGDNARFQYENRGDLRVCTCGAICNIACNNCYNCGIAFSDLEKVDIDELYNEGEFLSLVSLMETAKNRKDLIDLKNRFEKLGDYKESAQYVELISEKLKALELSASRRKKIIRRISVATTLLSAFTVAIITLFIPWMRMLKADSLYEEGKYKEAIEIYNDIDNFGVSEATKNVINATGIIDQGDIEQGLKDLIDADMKVKIFYDVDGTVHSKEYDKSNKLIFDAPTKSGYRFLKWEFASLNYEPSNKNNTFNITLKAVWDKTYTMTLNANGGSVSSSEFKLCVGDRYTLPTPKRTGYSFKGWYKGSVQYTNGVWNATSDVTLTARWEAVSYTVTFDKTANASVCVTFDLNYSGAYPYIRNLTNGECLECPDDPSRYYYVFTGWYTDSACTQRYDFDDAICEDMTLYAGWQYIGSFTQINAYEYKSENYHYSMSTYYTSSNSPNSICFVAEETGNHYIYRKNNSYSGYYSLNIYNLTTGESIYSGSYIQVTNYTSVSFYCSAGDVIVIQAYELSSYYNGTSIYFYFNGFYAPSVSDAIVETSHPYEYSDDSRITKSVLYDSTFTLPSIADREGYTFEGWYYGSTKVENGTWKYANNVTLTPRWSANEYTITLDANGGTLNSTTLSVTFDSSYTLPTPVREGYTFSGWYYDDEEYTGERWTDPCDLTLTATWVANEYDVTLDDVINMDGQITITFTDNYEDGSTWTETLTDGDVLEYPDNPMRDGYVFTGWYTDEECTELYEFSGYITEDMTLYAGWRALDYYVTNDSNYSWDFEDGTLTSTNKDHNSSSTFRITAISDMTVSFYYKTSSEGSYDYLRIYRNGSSLYTCSGETSGSYVSISLQAGEYIEFKYSKDGSVNRGDDCAYIYNLDFSNDSSDVYYNSTAVAYEPVCGYIYDEDSSETIHVTYGEEYVLPVPVRDGYTFDGWYNGSDRIEDGTWTIDSDVILVPVWTMN